MNMQNQMLSCFFPTTVIFIDDNVNYLEGMLSTLNMHNAVPKLFSNPIEAVQFINHHPSILQRTFIASAEEQRQDHARLDIDIRNFHKKILAAADTRFRELTVVVCDYAMPQKNGLQVLQEIKNRELKTVMLTGEADETLAVEAFNRGLIDHFLRKEATHFTETLNKIVLSLQQDYIIRETGLIVDNILLGKLPKVCALGDPAFIELFNDIKKKHHIIEYYLVDEQGSYLLLDQKGRMHFLAVLDAVGLDAFTQFAIDEQAPASFIEKLKTKQFIPFFYSEEDVTTKPNDWGSYLHPAQTLQGQNTYYYSLIPPSEIHDPMIKTNQTYEYFLEHAHN
jgi:CheY-like chemotaxis protein